jgi:hypothetical protein
VQVEPGDLSELEARIRAINKVAAIQRTNRSNVRFRLCVVCVIALKVQEALR